MQVQADAIVIANYEKFSSPFKDFIVLGSVNYPTDTWLVLGNFTAEFRNGEQVFPLDSYQHVRYIKLRFFSHYGSEYYCTLSQLKYAFDVENRRQSHRCPNPAAAVCVQSSRTDLHAGHFAARDEH